MTIPHSKNTNAQEEVSKSHGKYQIRIFYSSCKYEYNISNEHLKQAFQTHKHKSSSQTKNLLFTPQQYYD